MSESVLLSRDGAVATVTLNRPDRLNALDAVLGYALRLLMLELERDAEVRCVVLSDRLSAQAAADLGLVNFVFAESAIESETEKLAYRLAASPTAAYGKAKALLNRSLDSGIADQLDAEAQAIVDCAGSPDFAEGVAAFVAKHKPCFTGR